MKRLAKYWDEKPLLVIMVLAVILRLIAVIFAKGFGMHDDHFIIIEPAYSWAMGGDYDNWLPWSDENTGPSGHSFFYIGFMYLLFYLLEFVSIQEPQSQMLIVRLVHAAFSLLTVWYGYRLALKFSHVRTARIAGLLLAVYWFMPWLGVRNLIEMVCIPFMIMGTYYLTENQENEVRAAMLSGILFGLAFAVRYQIMVYIGGLMLTLILQQRWKGTISFAAGLLFSVLMTQGVIDLFIWKRPFAELWQYITYNIHYRFEYITGPWYNYLVFLLIILIPPVSVFLLAGYIKNWKKQALIFLPVLIFLVFHSVFPNKQERFIIPVIPFLIISGITGWHEITSVSGFWNSRKRWVTGSWVFFWIINLLLLPVVSTMYSKKARVESMTYLSQYPDIQFVLFDDTFRHEVLIPPTYYYGDELNVYSLAGNHPFDSLKYQLEVYGQEKYPRFILFFQDRDISQRVERIRSLLPHIVYETRIDPGLIDRVLYWLNPVNANQAIIIYRNTDFIPEKAGG